MSLGLVLAAWAQPAASAVPSLRAALEVVVPHGFSCARALALLAVALTTRVSPLMSSASLLIVADDLTGAADCAARCRHAGLPATIVVQAPRLPLPPGALAFTTDSRHLDPARAAQRVRTMVGALVGVTNAVWYKKIDSTLRGNLGSELDALLDTLGHPYALVCPAFPAHGRGLLDGRLTGAPVQPVHLPTLLAHQSQRAVAALPLAAVRAGSERLAAHVAEMRAGRARVLVVDALSEDDLHTIVAAAAQALPDALLCGSGRAGSLAGRAEEIRG